MKQKISLVIAISFILASCTSSDTIEPNPSTEDNGYFPVTVGTTWEYKVIDDGDTTDLTRKIDGDTLLYGKKYGKYYGFTATQTFKTGLYRRSNDTLFHLRTSQLIETPLMIERAGVAWAELATTGVLSETDSSRIVENGITRIVLGKTFNNVIHYQSTRTVAGIRQVKSNAYFAKGIGFIESYTSSDTTLLVSYSIK